MNSVCPQVASLPAFLSLLQLRQSCRWPVKPGVELQALCSGRGREVMLNLQTTFQPPGICQQLLYRRGAQHERYDGCFLCMNKDRVLSCWCQVGDDNTEDNASIARLFSLAGIELAG
ncbi:type III secretion system protein [Erwinia tracheiphila]|uniref:Type III secretion system protein n=1 Tax=Erwinia tracheiphila TaxID=65700 RepID=A0A345CUT1_9GAMM|nr:HrpV family type III secretion system protein [Erwinia tracheiphila]AXF77198.1 type III secretion system protein [Erwinia tracheiphila]UIA84110.1 type III secretion system protein [Erwinia tracheiphila]UIA92692.1 type III secretion system protein [Erwinia tracheiphila]